MVDYCIDTSIIVEFLRGNEAIENKINTIIYNGLNIFTTYITLCELYKGDFCIPKKKKKLKILMYLFKILQLSTLQLLRAKYLENFILI